MNWGSTGRPSRCQRFSAGLFAARLTLVTGLPQLLPVAEP